MSIQTTNEKLLFFSGGKRAKGRGGGNNRGVRGVDFGLGIGYNAESNNPPQNAAPSRSAAVNSLRTGMMAQFKSNFVAASSNSQNQGMNNTAGAYPNKGMVLQGFVSGGTIGGESNASRISSTFAAATPGAYSSSQPARDGANQKSSER